MFFFISPVLITNSNLPELHFSVIISTFIFSQKRHLYAIYIHEYLKKIAGDFFCISPGPGVLPQALLAGTCLSSLYIRYSCLPKSEAFIENGLVAITPGYFTHGYLSFAAISPQIRDFMAWFMQ